MRETITSLRYSGARNRILRSSKYLVRTSVLGGDRPAQLARILLEPLVIKIAELIDRKFGPPDLCDGRAAKAAENVANSPDGKADDQKADDRGHDHLAEPIGRGFAQTSEH